MWQCGGNHLSVFHRHHHHHCLSPFNPGVILSQVHTTRAFPNALPALKPTCPSCITGLYLIITRQGTEIYYSVQVFVFLDVCLCCFLALLGYCFVIWCESLSFLFLLLLLLFPLLFYLFLLCFSLTFLFFQLLSSVALWVFLHFLLSLAFSSSLTNSLLLITSLFSLTSFVYVSLYCPHFPFPTTSLFLTIPSPSFPPPLPFTATPLTFPSRLQKNNSSKSRQNSPQVCQGIVESSRGGVGGVGRRVRVCCGEGGEGFAIIMWNNARWGIERKSLCLCINN